MDTNVLQIDWDRGNWPKCGTHGVSQAEIEQVFAGDPTVFADPDHSVAEERFKAIGRTAEGRFVFLVFTIRVKDGARHYRPVSARFMHRKEVDHYEKSRP